MADDEGNAPATEGDGLGEARASRMGAAALLLAASVMASRFIGYFREVALAHQVGVGRETDAFYTAFFIPDILNYLLAGGALALAFIPLYNRVRRREGAEAGDELLATVLGTLGVVAIFATVVLWLAADVLLWRLFPDFAPDTHALALELTRIVLPAQIFFLTGGLLRAVLMAHGRFGAQAAAPLIYNVAIIAGGLVMGTVEGFAWGVLVGAFVGNWLYPLVEILRFRSVRLRFAPLHPHFKAYLKLAAPLMLGISLVTVDEWYEKLFGATLAVGTVAQLGFARKLMMAPVAIVGQAVAAAALPVLSRLHAEGREAELNESLMRTLRASLALAIFSAAAFFAFASPIVEVVFRYGAFSQDAAVRVAALLAILSLAVPGWVLQQVAVRAFYAREEMWRPMLLGSAIALLAFPLYWGLARSHAAPGLAWAGVIAISLNALLTLSWARMRFAAPSLAGLGQTCLRAGGIAVAAAVVGILLSSQEAGRVAALRDLAVGGAGFLIVGVAGVVAVGDETMKEGVNAILRRLRLRRGPPAAGER